MTAEHAVPRNRAGSFALQAALTALIVGALAAFGGWLYTVRELNRLAAYHVVGAEAVRLAHSVHAEPEPLPAIYAGKSE